MSCSVSLIVVIFSGSVLNVGGNIVNNDLADFRSGNKVKQK